MKIKPSVFYTLMLVSLCAASMVAGIGIKRSWFKAAETRAATAPANEKLEVEMVTLRRFGFEPSAITRSSKSFLLKVNNRFNQPTLALSLNQIQNNRVSAKVREVNLVGGQIDWTAYLTLSPGEYELTEASHPEWKCRITVTAP